MSGNNGLNVRTCWYFCKCDEPCGYPFYMLSIIIDFVAHIFRRRRVVAVDQTLPDDEDIDCQTR